MLFHVDVCTFMLPLLSHTNPVISQNCPHTEPCCPIMFPCCPQPCPYTSATKTLLILGLLPHCPVLFPMVSHAAVSCAVPTLTYNASCTLLFLALLTHRSSCPSATPHSLTILPAQCLHCLHTAHVVSSAWPHAVQNSIPYYSHTVSPTYTPFYPLWFPGCPPDSNMV